MAEERRSLRSFYRDLHRVGQLMARLREMHEHHDWQWESARRQAVQRRIECLETDRRRRSLVPVDAALQKQMEELPTARLPDTIQLTAGLLTVRCNGMEDLLRQLVLLAKMADADYERLRALIEVPIPRRSPALWTAFLSCKSLRLEAPRPYRKSQHLTAL